MALTTAVAPGATRSPRREIVGLRVYTHAAITPAWLVDSVLPVWASARDGGRRLVSLRRGWLGGPHVDVTGVGPGAETAAWADLVRDVHAGPPPATPLDAGEYLERARTRGRLENVAPPYLPLRDHGTTVLLDQSTATDGASFGLLRAVADAVLAPAVVRSLHTVRDDPAHEPTTLLDVLTCVAQAHALDAGFGTFSLRSHAEALVAHWSPSGDLRSQFRRRYDVQRDDVVTRVRTLLAGEGGADVTAWRVALAYVQGVVDEAVRRGELTNELVDTAAAPTPAVTPTPPTPSPSTARSATAPDRDDHPDTDFHRTVYGSGATDGAGEWFAGYRFLVNCVYAQLPLLDVSPVQRAYGCWAVAEAVDEVLGESWAERLARGGHQEGER